MSLAKLAQIALGPLRALRPLSALAFAVVVLECALLFAYEPHRVAAGPNLRYERLERLGAETSSSDIVANGNAATLASAPGALAASATWHVDRYEFSHVLPRAASCRVDLYVTGLQLQGATKRAQAAVFFNDSLIRRIRFARTAPDGLGPGELRPVGLEVRPLRMSPLTAPLSFVFALPDRACRADRFDVTLVVRAASWRIERVGFAVEFVPVRPAVDAGLVAAAVAAIAVLALGAYALAAALTGIQRRAGRLGLGIAVAVLLLSPLTHDEWDSLIWPRFTDLAAFGAGNPANMWPGTPLWAIAPAVLGPVLRVSYAFTGDGGQGVTLILLKMAMAIAFVGNAAMVARLAPGRYARYAATLMLLAPAGLFEVAGGYRETFAVTFAIAAFLALERKRFVLASLGFALGASISESLITLIALPAVLAFALAHSRREGVRTGAIALVTAVGTIALQYAILTPTGFASTAVATRVLAYRYGGASWFAVADAYHALPSWVGPNSIAIVVVLFALLALPPAVRIVLALRGPQPDRARAIVFAFAGFVAATFLAYRGIDPNDWYALFAIATCAFVWFEPVSPLPLVLGTVTGLAFYTIVGVGNFVDWRYLVPVDRGLFGTLGDPVQVAVALANVVILVLYVATLRGSSLWLFGRASVAFGVLFAAGLAASASQALVADAVLFAAAAVIALDTYARLLALAPETSEHGRGVIGAAVLATALVAVGPIFARGDQVASSVAFLAFGLALTRGVATMDVLLALGAIAFLTSETRFGWVSIVGLVAMSLVAVATVARIYELVAGVRRLADERVISAAPEPRA